MRIKKHKDGSIFISTDGARWHLVDSDDPWNGDDLNFNSDEWTELYVAELPKPNGYELRFNQEYPFWNIADLGRITTDGEGITLVGSGTRYDLDDIEQEALIMLAAVTHLRKESNGQ